MIGNASEDTLALERVMDDYSYNINQKSRITNKSSDLNNLDDLITKLKSHSEILSRLALLNNSDLTNELVDQLKTSEEEYLNSSEQIRGDIGLEEDVNSEFYTISTYFETIYLGAEQANKEIVDAENSANIVEELEQADRNQIENNVNKLIESIQNKDISYNASGIKYYLTDSYIAILNSDSFDRISNGGEPLNPDGSQDSIITIENYRIRSIDSIENSNNYLVKLEVNQKSITSYNNGLPNNNEYVVEVQFEMTKTDYGRWELDDIPENGPYGGFYFLY